MAPIASSAQRDGTLVPAGFLLAAAMTDPQLRLPLQPRVVDGVAVVRLPGSRIVFEGASERQVLKGKSTALVEQLLPLLDGTRTVGELAAAVQAPDRSVAAVIAALYTCGVVEDSAEDQSAPPGEDGVGEEVRLFLARSLDSTRVNRTTAQAVARLAGCRAGVVGSGLVPEKMRALLQASGVGTVSDAGPSMPLTDTTFVVAWANGLAHEELRDLDDKLAAEGIPWLLAGWSGKALWVGPGFDRRYTPCYECVERRSGGRTWASADEPGAPWVQTAVAGFIVTEVVHQVARVNRANAQRGMVKMTTDPWATEHFLTAPVPGCSRCCPAGPFADDLDDTAFVFERSVAFAPRDLLSPKDHQAHYRLSNLALQRDFKWFPGQASIPLPPLDDVPVLEGSAGIDLHGLATVLALMCGLRPGEGERASQGAKDPTQEKVHRWAPTGGNLGSVQAYLQAPTGVLPEDGWYFYQARQHSLARLPDQEAAGAGVESCPPDRASLVLTAAHLRVRHKYGDFAYRVVHLDAGAALAHAALAAERLGFELRLLETWDDAALAGQLGLAVGDEPITAVAHIMMAGEAR